MDENHFRTLQKTTDREPPSFKIGNRVYFKNKQSGKWDLKWRPGYRIAHIEHDGHYPHIENQATGKTRSCNIKDVVFKSPVDSGTSTHNLAELEDTSTTLQICKLSCSLIEDENFTHVHKSPANKLH